MEPLAGPGTPGAEPFTDAQVFVANYASELGLSPAGGCSPAYFTDSGELMGGLGGLGDVVCWSDNVDHCISYLNKELVMLGIPALYKDDGSGDGAEHGFDLLALVNGTSELLNLYQAAMAKLGDMEAEDVRRAGELDYLRMRHGKLKDQVEGCEKEIAAVQNKEQQLQSKNKQLISMLKEEKDEITKLQNALATQKNQLLIEAKKKEQELLRLKEKMNQLTMDKKHQRGGTIDILNAMPRADGRRGTWKTGKSLGRKEEELYRVQLAKQEQREQALAEENAKLKQLMNEVGHDLEELLRIKGMEQTCPYETFQEQWRSLKNRIKMLGWQAVDTLVSQMSEEEGEDPVISVTDHDKEIMKLKGEIEESRVQITQLKQCLQEQLFAVTTSELPAHLKDSYFLEEQQRLQEEQDLFEEQKRAFERERENFTEAAIRLGWERKQFEDEKAQFLKQEFLLSFPKLASRDPIRRFSIPVCAREEQEREDLPNIRRRVKPVCTPYPRPKVIFTPRRTSGELFRRRQLAFNPATPTTSRQRVLLAENWPASPPLFSQVKESHKEIACQTDTLMKEDPPGELLDQFLDSFL
ncbi:afadin- and alpha-actinin-binding protein B [Pogona vitticeps]